MTKIKVESFVGTVHWADAEKLYLNRKLTLAGRVYCGQGASSLWRRDDRDVTCKLCLKKSTKTL